MKRIIIVAIALIVLLSFSTVQAGAIAATAAVSGVAIAGDIIISIGMLVLAGATLQDAVKAASTEKAMEVREFVQDAMESFADFAGLTWKNFCAIMTQGVSYSDAGVLLWDKGSADMAAEFIQHICANELKGYVLTGTPDFTFENQSEWADGWVVDKVFPFSTLWKAALGSYNLVFEGTSGEVFANFVAGILDTDAVCVQIYPQGQTNVSVSNNHIYVLPQGTQISWDRSSSTNRGRSIALNAKLIDGTIHVTKCTTSTGNLPFYRNGYGYGNVYTCYNNVLSLTADVPVDTFPYPQWQEWGQDTIGLQVPGEMVLDMVGALTAEDALVAVDEWVDVLADSLFADDGDVLGVDVIGIDEAVELTLDAGDIADLADAAIPVTGELSVPDSIPIDLEGTHPITGTTPDEVVDPSRPFEYTGDYTLDLTQFFPFCIPFDLYRILTMFDGVAQAPYIDWPISVPSLGIEEHVVLDLSVWDNAAQVLRGAETVAFAVGLCFLTKKLIQGG